MCAIFGFKCLGPIRPSIEDIADIATASESRGKDASGLAWLTKNGEIGVAKAPIESSIYLKRENIRELFASDGIPSLLIGHARAATQGSP